MPLPPNGLQDFRVGIIGVDMKGVFSPTILIGAENAFQARSAAALLFNASGNEALFHSGIERMLVQGLERTPHPFMCNRVLGVASNNRNTSAPAGIGT